ncbi:AraC family transcriptional regulator [Leptospira sp. GIMC2001]|uniref:AraC family transcriptional regulator n=1 Tax=Leptospira sp. GIMC2001 TaxID=1513297 RepID=UPI00234A1DB7|nr:AraC family transcriptional regulator [Leptospira sp. GIMC2001]WCL50193.1 AraC family transcriptional regulator [Leptospira sp. GIMC2001]
MDLLSEILDTANWKNDLLSRKTLHGNWGLKFPCERSGGFHIITQGFCYVRFNKQIIKLEKGDLFFITQGLHHDLVSTPKEKALDINQFHSLREATKLDPNESKMAFISVRYEVPDGPRHPFFNALPEYIHVKGHEVPNHDPIHSTTQLISQEIESGIGSSLIIQRLTDILLYYAIRRWIETNSSNNPGWIAVFRDEKILSCLETIHKNPLHNWTIESLANTVGMSRASLAARFKQALGETPIDYLAKLRLDRGRYLLENADVTLEDVSRQVGYSSAFAFSKAYKRIYGHSPRSKNNFIREEIAIHSDSESFSRQAG